MSSITTPISIKEDSFLLRRLTTWNSTSRVGKYHCYEPNINRYIKKERSNKANININELKLK